MNQEFDIDKCIGLLNDEVDDFSGWIATILKRYICSEECDKKTSAIIERIKIYSPTRLYQLKKEYDYGQNKEDQSCKTGCE